MFRKLTSFIPYFLRSLWIVDVHRGSIDMLSNQGLYMNIGFNAQSRRIRTGTRAFRRHVYHEAKRFAEAGNGKLIRVRLQEISVMGTVVILREDEVSEDAVSIEVIPDPKFREIAMFGSEDFTLVNL